jgi:hypothetical protein
MSGGGTTTNQIQNKDPWAPSVPMLNQINSSAQNLYNSGAGSQTWGGPLVAPQSQQTQMGINALTNTAQSQMGTASQPLAYGQNLIQNNGLTSGYQAPLSTYGGIASGQNGITTGAGYGAIGSGANGITTGGQYGALGQSAGNISSAAGGALAGVGNQANSMANGMGPTSSSQNLGGMASGATAGNNPYMQRMLQDNANLVGNRVASQMSGSGRLGSFGYGDAMARSITAANAPILSSAYENDQNRMLSASGQIDSSQRALDASRQGALGLAGNMYGNAGSMGLAGNAQQLSALQGQTGVQSQNIANQLSGLAGQTGVQGANIANQMQGAAGQTGILNSGQQNAAQWASMIPQLTAASYAPANAMLGAGGMQDQFNQQLLAAQQQQFQQQQQMPWTQLSKYGAAVSGLAPLTGNSGSSMGQSQTQNQTPWTQYAGLGIAGLGLLSDRNEKTDIKKLGDDPSTGLPMYAFRYKDDPKSYPKIVGPMAQDIEAAMPGSTERVGGKLYIKPEATMQLGILAMLNKKQAA